MKQSSGQIFICHGFNNYCKSPKSIGGRKVMFRTAVIIKKRDCYDKWDVYDDLFWRMVAIAVEEMADDCCIKAIDQTAPTFGAIAELREWQSRQKESDSEFVLDPPGEIDLFSAGVPICHIELEDWSDIVKYEPYACSFTFSFYSYDENVNATIGNVLHEFFSSEKAVSGVSDVYEVPHPKWYWPLLTVIRSDTFFFCAGLCSLALFAIVMIIVSPSSIREQSVSSPAKGGFDNLNTTWRRDVTPVTKRIPALSSCTNMLWHGEIIAKNSLLSVPGPSTYRVCCFIPNASKSILDLSAVEYSQEVIHDGIDFLPAEKAMLKSEFKIDPDSDAGIFNEQLTHKLLQSPYWGQSLYFKTNDVLCIVLFGK